jgi:FdhD protein
MGSGLVRTDWQEFQRTWSAVKSQVIEEALITIYVNGVELATIMATPFQQEYLAVGFMKNEGLIEDLDEVDHVHISRDGCCVDVWLNRHFVRPDRVIITSGCGGGITFDDPNSDLRPLQHTLEIHPTKLFELFNALHSPDSLHAQARGVHTAGLSDGREVLVIAEDVGRHNTIDKIMGFCLYEDLDPDGLILLATGRVSSEMLRKGMLMGTPIIASRNSPTSMSIEMARAANITLIGYVRRNSMRVYSHPERLKNASPVIAGE